MEWFNCWACGGLFLAFVVGAIVGNQLTVYQLGKLADAEELEIKYKGVKIE